MEIIERMERTFLAEKKPFIGLTVCNSGPNFNFKSQFEGQKNKSWFYKIRNFADPPPLPPLYIFATGASKIFKNEQDIAWMMNTC